MAKVYDEKINKTTDWGGDDSTGNLPVSGSRVQEFIKDQLNSKFGYQRLTDDNAVQFFDSVESAEKYDLNPESNADLLLDTLFLPSVGAGTKLVLAFVSPSNLTTVYGKDLLIKYTFSSTLYDEQTGEGIATYILNNKQVSSETIAQGEVSFNAGKYLSLGDNVLVVQVTDSYGATRKLTFKISAVKISVTSTFDDSRVYTGAISFPYTPLGAVEKTIHFVIDGKEIGTYVTSVSNRQQTYSIPSQTHGAHLLEVYATATIDGVYVESDRLRYDIISVTSGNNTPIIASSFLVNEVEQFSTLLIPYIVYNPAATTSNITLSANGTVISEQTADRTRQTWSYRAEASGALALKIACGSVSKTFNLTVSESEIDVRPESADLVLFLTSVNRSNNEEGKNIWNYGEIFALLTAFNWATNGWIKTIEGFTALRVSGDARVIIPYNSFANDFRATGKTIEFEFETRDVTNYDAIVLSCMSGGIGLEVTAQKAVFKSEQTTVETQFKEDERVRISFVVEKRAENRLIYVFVNGEMCGVVQYPEQDNFTQSNPVGISIGNDKCTADMFNIRVYDNNLNRYQLLDNYIADMDNIDLKREMYERNRIYDDYGNVSYEKLSDKLPALTIIGALPSYKGDKVTCAMSYEDRQHPERSWICLVVQNDVQGTSSQYYPRKNYKFKFKALLDMIQEGVTSEKFPVREGDIPVNCFCMKADFAESSGCHNTGMARMIDFILRGLDQLTPPQRIDQRVRTTIDGYPIVIFHKETEDSDPTFLGKYNFNNDKSTQETFGFTDGCECWEIRNNTSDRVLFKVSDYSTDDWLNDFEARYPEDSTDFTNLKRLTDWLVSVKENPVKFKAEASQYLDMDFMLSYYVLTEFFAMVDQRAKNVFLTTYDGTHWLVIFYDNDTCLGINNEGVNAFDFTVEYHDKIGTQDVWNGEQSTLWNNIEQAYKEEIAAMYADMRKNGLLTYEKCDYYLNREQCDKWGESVYNEDGYFKYIRPLLDEGNGSYLYAAQGSRKMHRIWWLNNRFKYMDSKYVAGDYKNDFATMRLYTPMEWTGVAPNADITVTSYSGQYVNIKYGSYIVGGRTKKDVPYKVTSPDIQFNDTETIIYGAGQISSLGDLSALYAGTVDVSKMSKLTELIVGSGVAGYKNTNLSVLSVGANNLMRKLDVRNCPNLVQAIDVSQCANIREIWAEGTGTTAVVLPEGGNLTLLHLPDTITNLTIRNQSQLDESGLLIEGVENLSTIRWENTNGINVLSIIDRCFALDEPKLERIRIIGADWTLSTLNSLIRLINLKGLDENGNNVDKAVVTGKCYVSVATDAQINKLKAAFPELTITYGQLKPMPVTTFTFSSSQRNAIKNSVLECDYEIEKVNEYTYKITSEDNITIDFTFKCENHEDFKGSYLVAGTRSQNYTVTYIPLRKLRVKVYNQSIYVQGATVTIDDKTYISDANGYVTLPRGGGAVSGTVSAYGYASNTFSLYEITSDQINTITVYGTVEVKFIVKTESGALLSGATVESGSQFGTTNIYGECILSLGKGDNEYTVSLLPNYITKSDSITVGTSDITVDVTLELNMVTLKPEENGNIQMLLGHGNGREVYIIVNSNKIGFIIDWGDGTVTDNVSYGRRTYYHTYESKDDTFQVEVKNPSGIISCDASSSNLIAYWSIGTSAVSGLKFNDYRYLKYIGNVFGNDLDRTDLSYLLNGCSSLTTIDLSPLSVMTKVTTLVNLLSGCSKLTNVDLSPLSTMTKVTTLESLLNRCSSLTSVDLSPLSAMTEVTDLEGLLSNCSKLTNVDLSPLSAMTKVTTLKSLLFGCSSLTCVDLSPLSAMTEVTDLAGLLYDCSSLTTIDLSPLSVMTKVTTLGGLLYRCWSLTSVDLSPLSAMTEVTTLVNLLYGCSKLTNVDLSPLSAMTEVTTLVNLLFSCSKLTNVDLSPLSTMTKVTTLENLLKGCSSLTSVDLSPLSAMSKITNLSNLFCDCKKLINVNFLDTSQMEALVDISWMFCRCYNLTTIIGNLFTKSNNLQNVSYFMMDCTSYASELPPFWEWFYGRKVTKNACFTRCKKAPNWHDVPISWGGEAEEWCPEYNGTITIKIFKDSQWWLNQSVVIAGITFAQQVDGSYSAHLSGVRGNEVVPVFVNGIQIGTIRIYTNKADYILLFGDTSGMYDGVYLDFTTGNLHEDKVTSNDGWTYDSGIEALKSNKISALSSTSIVVSTGIIGEATIIYGQNSESVYDYCTIYNSTGTKLLDLKGESYQGDDLEIKLTTTDGILKFTYRKDGSGDTGKDAVWIKTISNGVLVLPPLPSDFIPNSMLSGVVRADYRALDTRLKVVESKLNMQQV